ncbi:hypothetical protein MACH09_04720 [Vibrio sp. MACH09]|uniref:TetR/AcrR family transcriptional regulator n=1 Tax=Vibrio sp. MACH09 TaxID=3025122 RepID=UPI00278D0C8E|nr:TetR/AcrR family transcriptional regulator [Vibrio sp. MACH09]GLO59964.1 hypothetical protein MACH09_04720 [Vibrio sp. MACH09]
MGKIEQNKERKRKAILDAAKGVFLSEGYAQASMDQIASDAEMTKQTVYRYFPSKIELFKATLEHMGSHQEYQFLDCLDLDDSRQALQDFANNFIRFHLSDEHIATMRLLIAESSHSPDMIASFMSIGPDKTDSALATFFSERFGIENSEVLIQLWMGMLLSLRTNALLGMEKPSSEQIEQHASQSTHFLFTSIER